MIKVSEKNYSIFIAGSTGMVGSAIKRKLIKLGYGLKGTKNLLTPTRKELDLLDNNSVLDWFELKKNES